MLSYLFCDQQNVKHQQRNLLYEKKKNQKKKKKKTPLNKKWEILDLIGHYIS